jgi:CelD/BcsL family acetyltransferase involved in cellulose biosynthesis
MKARRLSRLGRITHIEYREADSILGRLAVFFAQHVRQWSARLGSVLTFSDPELACFYAGAVPNLTTVGAVALHELRLDDNPLAFYYGYRDATTFYGYRPSYNIKWKRYSPGALLLRAMVQSFQVQGLTCFDMMRGSESYKLDYATEVTRNKALHLTGLYT